MIEMLGVLAIVGVLSAGGIAGYSMAMQSYRTNLLIERMHLIIMRVRQVYKNGNYMDISNTKMIKSGKLSEDDFKNPFGGDLELYSEPDGTFKMYVGVPEEPCVEILTMDWGESVAFWLNGMDWYTDISGSAPADITEASRSCSGGAGVQMYFEK